VAQLRRQEFQQLTVTPIQSNRFEENYVKAQSPLQISAAGGLLKLNIG
jgi:hypothetical protein